MLCGRCLHLHRVRGDVFGGEDRRQDQDGQGVGRQKELYRVRGGVQTGIGVIREHRYAGGTV